MVKKVALSALVIAFLISGVASGQTIQSLPGGGWWTSAGIQNVGSDTATVSLTAYHLSGGASDTHSVTTSIPKDGSKAFLPGIAGPDNIDVSPPLEPNFAGSMVIASDQPLVAIGQVGNNNLSGLGTVGGYASGMYRGLTAGGSTISFPIAKSNYGNKTSTFYVQAIGGNVTAAATVKTNDGVSHTHNYSIQENKSVVVSMSDFTPAIPTTNCGSGPTSPCLGAITIVATGGTLAGVSIESDTSVVPATRAQVASMFDPANDAATTLYCPIFKYDYGGRHTGVTVQNVSGGPVNVYATLVATLPSANGSYYASKTNLADGASYNFMGVEGSAGGYPINFAGAAVITATGKILAAVNEANFSGVLKATTYTCFSSDKATTKVAMPQVKEMYGVNTTGVVIQNVGVTTTTINAAYTCSGVTYTAAGIDLGSGKGFTYFKPSQGNGVSWIGSTLPSNRNCAVTVTAGQKIVGIAQEAATTNLDTKNYEGFSVNP